MIPIRVKLNHWLPKNQIFIMADASHPEVPLFLPIEEATALWAVCHPAHDQVLRDAIALLEEYDWEALEGPVELLIKRAFYSQLWKDVWDDG